TKGAIRCSFGLVSPEDHVWLLPGSERRAMLKLIRRPFALASFYFFELHRNLDKPDWVEAFIGSKAIAIPVRSLLAWDFVLRAIRGASGSIALLRFQGEASHVSVVNENGEALDAQILVRWRRTSKRSNG